MRLITLFFSVAFLALAAWAWGSPGIALTVPVSTKTGLAAATGLTTVSEKKVVQIRWRRRTAVSSKQRRKAAKAWAKAKKRPSASGSRTSEATRRALDQLLLRDALRSARFR